MRLHRMTYLRNRMAEYEVNVARYYVAVVPTLRPHAAPRA